MAKWLRYINERLQSFHDGLRRQIDLRVLWPAILHHAMKRVPETLPNTAAGLELAREAFIMHMREDPIWRRFADPMSERQFGDWVRSTLV